MIKKCINPVIFEKTQDGEIYYDIFSRLIKERIIFLAEEIDAEVASTVAATLFFLDTQDKEEPISLYINSPGGYLECGLFAIYDMMNMICAPVKTYCIGEATSAAAVILAAGSRGHRYALPNSRIMIHEVQVSDISGTGSEVENQSKTLKYVNKKLIEIIARHTGQTHSKVSRDCKMDTWMNAEEAEKYGIIDHVLKPNKDIPDLIKAVKKPRKRTSIVPAPIIEPEKK
jgi:ATP-dependent Clp protease, protease subunit